MNLTNGYPAHWPKPNRHKPATLATRITEQQKQDLYNRKVTTRELATILGVHERYLSQHYSGKVPVLDKKPLIEARKAFKLEIAKQILDGKITGRQASKIANVSYRTMVRFKRLALLAQNGNGVAQNGTAGDQPGAQRRALLAQNTPQNGTAVELASPKLEHRPVQCPKTLLTSSK